jgi:hypothetical protein
MAPLQEVAAAKALNINVNVGINHADPYTDNRRREGGRS